MVPFLIIGALLILAMMGFWCWAMGKQNAKRKSDQSLTDALTRFTNRNDVRAFQTPSEELTGDLCQKLRDNISVDPLFTDRYGCVLEYEFHGEYEHLRVDLEAAPVCDGVPLPSELLLGVKVYDAKEELLHTESIRLYPCEDESRYTCSFYLESLRIAAAAFMEFYAIEEE